jgi:hypothetical protein
MRWSNKLHTARGGETRINRRFAWTPTIVGQWVVLFEYYEMIEQYIGEEWVELERYTLQSK